jgi:hypothetical protein
MPLDVNVSTELLVDSAAVTPANPVPTSDADAHTSLTEILTQLASILTRLNQTLDVNIGANIELGEITVAFDSRVSTLNSTQTPLDADEEFVGTWEEVLDYAAITATFYTDVDSAVNGAIAEFSHNGVDVITSKPSSVVGNYGGFAVFAPEARYFRVRYLNGAAPQTVLRSEIRYLFNAPTTGMAPIGFPTTDAAVVTTTKASLQGRIGAGPYTGLWQPVLVDEGGQLQVEVTNAAAPQTDALTDTELRAAPVSNDPYPKDLRIERYLALTGNNEIRYLFTAAPAASEVADVWTGKRFSHDADGLISIETLTDVAWADRATLW